jgi:hypothetical protein
MKIFISGSLSINELKDDIINYINILLSNDYGVIIGDAKGVDRLVQKYLSKFETRTTIFCSGQQPRNNIGDWPVQLITTTYAKGSRAFFTAKDIRMAEVADIGLMIWDTKSTGTLSNVIELLSRKKKSVVFVNKVKIFKNITTLEQLKELLTYMSESDKQKADEKIKLFDRIDALRQEQLLVKKTNNILKF